MINCKIKKNPNKENRRDFEKQQKFENQYKKENQKNLKLFFLKF